MKQDKHQGGDSPADASDTQSPWALMPDAPQDSLDEARAMAKVWSGLFSGGHEAPRVGQYYLLEELGAGAMGVVYSAYDPQLQRHVALKLLHRDRESAPGSTARLLREARALARVSHPNVVGVHAVGTGPNGAYIAMEYVEGQTLADWLASQSPPWQDVLQCFVDAGRGLTAAHDAGIIHRDFKPTNVLVGNDGIVRVVDFGLAWETAETQQSHPEGFETPPDSQDRLTRTGARVGTPAYMAPEQRRGEEASAAADQFAFCVSLYEGLWGRRPAVDPRSGAVVSNLRAPTELARRSPAPPSSLLRVLQRGLAEHAVDRFPSVRALVQALQAAERPRRKRAAAVSGLAVVSTMAVLAAIGTESPAQPTDPCATAASAVDPIWNRDRLGQVVHRLHKTAGKDTASQQPWAVDTLDQYVAGWAAARTQTCTQYQSGMESADLFDARVECLDRRLRLLGGVIDTLETEPLSPQRIEDVLAALEPVAACQAPASTIRLSIVPSDPAQRAEGEALLSRVDYEFTRASAGLVASADVLDEIRVAAERTTHLSARGNARRFLAAATKDVHECRQLRVKVIADALEARNPYLLVLGYLELAREQDGAGDRDSALESLELARAANRRLASADANSAGSVALYQGGIDNTRAGIAREQGDYALALQAATAAAAAWESTAVSRPLWLANALNNVGEGLRLIGRPREAIPLYDRALALAQPRLGKKSVTLGMMYNNRAAAWFEAGEPAAVLRDLRAGRAHLEATGDVAGLGFIEFNEAEIAFTREHFARADKHYEAADALFLSSGTEGAKALRLLARLGQASVARELGHHEAALAELEDVAQAMITLVGPRHPYVAILLLERAQVLHRSGQLTVAYEDATAAMRMNDETGPVEGPALAQGLIVLAEIEMDAGRPDAREHLLHAVGLIEATDSPFHYRLARAELLLGTLELEAGTGHPGRRVGRAAAIAQRHDLGPALRGRIETLREAVRDAG